MNTDYTANITEIFYSVDEFCKQIEPQFKKKAIGEDGKKRRNRAFKMSDSEIITISQVMSEKVCKILLRPSPPAWGTPSRRGICDVDFYLSFYLIFHSRKYGSRLAYVPSVFSLATEPKR